MTPSSEGSDALLQLQQPSDSQKYSVKVASSVRCTHDRAPHVGVRNPIRSPVGRRRVIEAYGSVARPCTTTADPVSAQQVGFCHGYSRKRIAADSSKIGGVTRNFATLKSVLLLTLLQVCIIMFVLSRYKCLLRMRRWFDLDLRDLILRLMFVQNSRRIS